jgi:hypothetical protein
VVGTLVTLAGVTTSDIIFDIMTHLGPEKGSRDKFMGLGNPKMASGEGVVALFKDLLLEIRQVWDTEETIS